MPFPLAVAPFEHYMLKDDRPSHPMAFIIRLRLSGRLDESVLVAAIDRSVRRHPMLRARLGRQRRGKRIWVEAPESRPYVDFAENAAPMRYPGSARIDLRRENGLRIWARRGDGSAEIRFQFHHACCDGIGAYQFIEDVMCAYDQAARPRKGAAELRQLCPESPTGGVAPRPGWSVSARRLPQQIWGLVAGATTFACGRPVPLCSPDQPIVDEAENQILLDYPIHTYSRTDSKRLRDISFACGASLNDLLLRDLFLAFRAWNVRHDRRTRRRRIRIVVPTSLREPGQRPGSAANVVSMVYMGRGARCEHDPRRMLRGIQREAKFFLKWRLSLALIRWCQIGQAIPGAIEWVMSIDRCYATSVFSNAGRVLARAPLRRIDRKFVIGNLTIERIESAPPVRPHVSAALSCLSYAGELTLVMNYDRYRFTPEAARELMGAIVLQTRKTLELGR